MAGLSDPSVHIDDPGFDTLGVDPETGRVSWGTTVSLAALRVLVCLESVTLRSRAYDNPSLLSIFGLETGPLR